jgi:hypothetical protein
MTTTNKRKHDESYKYDDYNDNDIIDVIIPDIPPISLTEMYCLIESNKQYRKEQYKLKLSSILDKYKFNKNKHINKIKFLKKKIAGLKHELLQTQLLLNSNMYYYIKIIRNEIEQNTIIIDYLQQQLIDLKNKKIKDVTELKYYKC